MGCFACFDGGKQQRKEEDRLASQEARAKAAEAAEKRNLSTLAKHSLGRWKIVAFAFNKPRLGIEVISWEVNTRQEQFDKSAAGRAARAQLAAAAKQSAKTNKGEPVLKWQMG